MVCMHACYLCMCGMRAMYVCMYVCKRGMPVCLVCMYACVLCKRWCVVCLFVWLVVCMHVAVTSMYVCYAHVRGMYLCI